jgi:hypothetical protein
MSVDSSSGRNGAVAQHGAGERGDAERAETPSRTVPTRYVTSPRLRCPRLLGKELLHRRDAPPGSTKTMTRSPTSMVSVPPG